MKTDRTGTAKWIDNRKLWRISVQKDGVRKYFSSAKPGRAGQREANAKADKWLSEGETKRLTVAQAWSAYSKSREGVVSVTTRHREESYYRNWLHTLSKRKLDTLTPLDFSKILGAAYRKGLSKKSIQDIRGTCVQFLKFCRLARWTDLRIDDVSTPKGARTGEKHILQPEHLRILFSTDTTVLRGKEAFDDYVYAYRLQVLTGLRPSELVALKWSDIDDFVIHVRGSIDRYGNPTKGKNQNAVRDIYLNDMLRSILNSQKSMGFNTKNVFSINSEHSYRNRFIRYCESNGIPHTTPYELRHTFVSVAKNLSVGQLKQIVGHSESMDTYGVYSHTVDGDLESASRQLNDIFSSFILPEKEA